MKRASRDNAAPPGLETLEQMLGHSFSSRELLQNALTHSSHANELADGAGAATERPLDNEQLEFLGDAVLGFVTSRELFERYPGYTEGQLSKMRAHLVSAKHLIKVARALSLGRYLRLGRGEERSGGRSKSALLVDALEAVIAALYLEGGLETARNFVLKHVVVPELEILEKNPALAFSDQKSALQEWLQATGGPQPAYQVVQEEGPDHRKTFTVELKVQRDGAGTGAIVCRASGTTKKIAEQKVAQQALNILQDREKKK